MSKIEWCDITLNPIAGKCPHGCEYCYAEAMRRRFHWSEAMTFKPEVIEKMLKLRNPRAIFWGSVFDLFADTVPTEWLNQIFEACNSPEGLKHSHIFLTKNPKRYAEFAHYKNHENIFFGVSMTLDFSYEIDFVSIEPLTDNSSLQQGVVSSLLTCRSVIIGGLTGQGSPYHHLSLKTLKHYTGLALQDRNLVFIKNNIKSYIPDLVDTAKKFHFPPNQRTFRSLPWQLHTKKPLEVRP